MANAPVDLLALNRQILLNPSAAGGNELVALLELEQPGLEFLCPLARAIYWVETNRLDRFDSKKILGTVWLIDDNETYDVIHEEIVNHSILIQLEAHRFSLKFRSTTTMYRSQSESDSDPIWPEYIRVANALDWCIANSDHLATTLQKLFTPLDLKAQGSRQMKIPVGGKRTEKGDFIAECYYSFAGINEISVEGPTYVDTFADPDSWSGLSDQCFEEDRHAFCWLHYLSREQAEQIGIAAKGEEALGPDEDYPEWVSKTLITQGEGLWIDSDQIQSSYSEGTVIVEPSTEAWLAVGCGPEWDPNNHPDDQVNPEDGEWEQYPSDAGPLLRIEISRDEEVLPPELEALLPYIEKLHSLST